MKALWIGAVEEDGSTITSTVDSTAGDGSSAMLVVLPAWWSLASRKGEERAGEVVMLEMGAEGAKGAGATMMRGSKTVMAAGAVVGPSAKKAAFARISALAIHWYRDGAAMFVVWRR